MSHQAAIDILMDGAGRQWDPTVVRVFLETVQAGDGEAAEAETLHEHAV
jgi:HD-GYP domain-containing protein (c-di-GMP phosphodiesterase class II)